MARPDVATMRKLQKQGKAMPPAPGSDRPRFQIRNRQDLHDAILAVGRSRPNTDAERAKVRRFIQKRARALGLTSMIPDDWNSDGSLKTGDSRDDDGHPRRADPDHDGDNDATAAGDTDHDYWTKGGRQKKPLPGRPMPQRRTGG